MKTDGDGSSLVSFSLKDEPVAIEASEQKSKEQPLVISVVTANGKVHVFEHILNGHQKKPVAPKTTFDIVTGSSKPLKILAAQTNDDGKQNMLLCYGSVLKPSFEKYPFAKCSNRKTSLVREDSAKKSYANEIVHSKITEPLQPKDSKVIGPAQLAPSKPSDGSGKERSSKKKAKVAASAAGKADVAKESMFDGMSGTEPPTADSLVHLLVQGLESGDRRMLDTVFMRGDETIIKNTIDKLPLDMIPSLLAELKRYLYFKGDNNLIYMRWLERLIQSKLSFILTVSSVHQCNVHVTYHNLN